MKQLTALGRLKHIFLALGATTLAVTALTGCNGDAPDYGNDYDFSSVAVTAFSLKADKAVLNNLDTVFFSINLRDYAIFNADSLPMGTDVTALAVEIKHADMKVMELRVTRPDGTDTIVNFLKNPDTKINFAGEVRLHCESTDGTNSRDYSVRVNVHKMVSDTLQWAQTAVTELPTTLTAATEARTVMCGGRAVCLTAGADGGALSLAVAEPPRGGEPLRWQARDLALPLGRKVQPRTLTATASGALYILASDGALLRAATLEEALQGAWTATGSTWNGILGAYGPSDVVLGIRGGWGTFTRYDGSRGHGDDLGAVPAEFPVSGASQPVSFATKWAEKPQISIFGGRTARGALTSQAWAFDGNAWTCVGGRGLPLASGMAVARYTLCQTDTVTWRTRLTPVLIAMGGEGGAQTTVNTVYISSDEGMRWRRADALLQLPPYMAPVAHADLIAVDQTHEASRAVAPITQWECPYLYRVGGHQGGDGTLETAVWQGVINYLTFKPLQ